MNVEIGKVVKYLDNEGEIQTLNEKYFFIKRDLLNNVKVNDLVVFRPEKHDNINYAFFIQDLKSYLYNNKKDKDFIKKMLLIINKHN